MNAFRFLFVWGFFFSSVYWALDIAGSSASTKNMQKNLYLKLYAFCLERRHLPWGMEATLRVRKLGLISYWDSRCFRDLRRSCRVHLPASSLHTPEWAVIENCWQLLSSSGPPTYLMDFGYQEVLLERELCMSKHAIKWTVSVSGTCAGPWCLMALAWLSPEAAEALSEVLRVSRQAHWLHHAVQLIQKLWSFTGKFDCARIGAEWPLEIILFARRAAAVNLLGRSPSASAEGAVGARSLDGRDICMLSPECVTAIWGYF